MGKASLCPCLFPTSFEAQQNRSLGVCEKILVSGSGSWSFESFRPTTTAFSVVGK